MSFSGPAESSQSSRPYLPQNEQPGYERPERPAPAARQDQYAVPRIDLLLHEAIQMVENARPLPLSSGASIQKDELLSVLQEMTTVLPEEIRAARWLLRERKEFLAKVRREGDDILELARTRAERMVQRTELVRSAEQRARRVVEDAETHARRLRHEVDDWIESRLGQFQGTLEQTLGIVTTGRAKYQAVPTPEPARAAEAETQPVIDLTRQGVPAGNRAFFDQDNM